MLVVASMMSEDWGLALLVFGIPFAVFGVLEAARVIRRRRLERIATRKKVR
ncbi:MAG: hypothetical protein ACKVOP_04370 [Sphingomonadaceae bacterium]